MGFDMHYICQGGEWVTDATAMQESSKCDKEGDTKTQSILGYELKYVCTGGTWVPDGSAFGGGEIVID